MLDVMLIVSFAMCTFCSVRSLWPEGSGYAIAAALHGLVFLLGFLLFRMPGSTLVSLGRAI